MAAWQRCEQCRKVLPEQDFDGDSPACRVCLTGPVPKVRTTRSSAVTTTRSRAPAQPVAEAGPRAPLLGVVGSGDLEVRERRARRAALDALAELHSDDFEQLLQTARRGEGLRV